MRHKFTKTNIPEGEDYAIESCTNIGCNVRAKRYKKGNLVYLNERGKVVESGFVPHCVILPDLMSISSNKEEEKSNMHNNNSIILVTSDKATITEKSIIERKPFINAGLTQEEATLKDALTIVQLMYEDMIVHRVRTTSVAMARRFLSSQKYEETVKKIESKLT